MDLIGLINQSEIDKAKELIISTPSCVNSIDNEQNTALHYSVDKGDLELTQLLINSQSIKIDQQNIFGNTALMIACLKSDTGVVKELLNNGANPNLSNKDGFTSLHNAALMNNLPVMQELVEHNGDIHAKTNRGKSLLHLAGLKATEEQDLALTKWLLELGIDYQSNDNNGCSVRICYMGDGSDGSHYTDLVHNMLGHEVNWD